MKTADLERSKRLKELGWEQGVDSSYWVVEIENPDYFWIEQDKSSESGLYNNYCAPTASEMIEWLLGEDYKVTFNGKSVRIYWFGGETEFSTEQGNENALADAVIWVLEGKK